MRRLPETGAVCVNHDMIPRNWAVRPLRRAQASVLKFQRKRPTMSKRISVLATLLLLAIGGVSAQAADQTFTVRIENVSAANAVKLSNGKTEPVVVAPVLYLIHTNRAPLFTSGEPD